MNQPFNFTWTISLFKTKSNQTKTCCQCVIKALADGDNALHLHFGAFNNTKDVWYALMYHVFIQQGVFLCIDNCAVPTVEDNVFTHLEYISQGSTPRHSYTKQGSLGKNFINPLTLRICSSHTFCVLRSWVLWTSKLLLIGKFEMK